MITFSQLGNFGRAGNSMFQAAATISLAKDNNDEYIFPSSWKYKDSFNIASDRFSDNIKFDRTYNEPKFSYSPIHYYPNLNISGYLQSEKYFKNNKDLIINLLTPKNAPNVIQNTCAIHHRLGDYTRLQDYHPIMTLDYFNKAMGIIKAKKYLIFSDDINLCKKMFVGEQFEFSEGRDEIFDLALMSKCEHQITSASSYSWWGSYLNPNPNKIIVCPQKWFNSKGPQDTQDLIPESWIKI